MIETVIYEYMKERFKREIPVFMAYPSPAPRRFYLIERTGGNRENQICYATIAVQSYGADLTDAAKMNQKAVNAMFDALDLDPIADVKLNSDYNFPDLTRKRPRYQAVFNITHYEME